jgi:hypothetical protein
MIDLTVGEPVVLPDTPWGVLRDEMRAVRGAVDAMGIGEIAVLRDTIVRLRAEHAETEALLLRSKAELTLDEVGLRFEARAPHGALAELRRRIEAMATDGSAVDRPPFEDSLGVEADFVKILLRAYNAEAELLVHNVTAADLTGSFMRLRSAHDTLNRLAQSMGLRISSEYHRLRIEELQLTAIVFVEDDDEAALARGADLKALSELGAVKRRLVTEQRHYEIVRRDAEPVASASAATKLTELAQSLRSVTQRETEIRNRLAAAPPDAGDLDSFPLQMARGRLAPQPTSPTHGRARGGWLGWRRS